MVTADRYIERAALEVGRSDIHAVGMSHGTVRISGLPTIELVHYNRGKRAAHIDWLAGRPDATLPDLLVGGHYHLMLDDPYFRGAHVTRCLQPGSFQRETWFMSGSRDDHPMGGWMVWCQRAAAGWRILPEPWISPYQQSHTI